MKNAIAILTGTVMLLGVISCRKMDTLKPETKLTATKEGDYKKGDFVFSLSNLRKTTRARSVSGGVNPIEPSHLYVRFKPTTQAHISSIEENNIPTYPYPLATDSLDASNPDYSTLYTFLPIRKALPNCPFEILDSVRLMNLESELAIQAYKAAGKVQPMEIMSSEFEDTPGCDPWEDCPPEDPEPYDPPPTPPAPLNPADNRTVPATVTYNSCSMNTDVNYPSGRITVEETQWGNGGVAYEGVADVKVVILGPNGQRVTAQTNRYGCFKATGAIRGFRIPRPFQSPLLLPVIMNVQFVSDRKEIRGINNVLPTAPSQYSEPLLHIYDDISDRMNNADLSYERNTSVNTDDAKYYVASTVNNALYDFDEYAAQDGIMPPPSGIKILIHNFHSSASAPMFAALASANPLATIDMQYFLIAKTGALGAPLLTALPDVLYGYDWSNSANFTTDRIKETAYHEFSHASHFRKTSTSLWTDNIKFIVDYGLFSTTSYGHAGDPGVEKTDLIEMWGYFMGREYAHRRYGPNAHSSLTEYFNPATPINFINSWYAVAENGGHAGVNIFDWEHIPSRFLHDLLDHNGYNTDRTPQLPESNVVTDNVRNFTISTIYNYLDGSTTSPASLMNKLRGNLPSGNTVAAFDSLRTSYGY